MKLKWILAPITVLATFVAPSSAAAPPDDVLLISNGEGTPSLRAIDPTTGNLFGTIIDGFDFFTVKGVVVEGAHSVLVAGNAQSLSNMDEINRYSYPGGVETNTVIAAGSGGITTISDFRIGSGGSVYVASQGVRIFSSESGSFQGGIAGTENVTSFVFGPNGELFGTDGNSITRFSSSPGPGNGVKLFDSGDFLLGEIGDLEFGNDGLLYGASISTDSVFRINPVSGGLVDIFSTGLQLLGGKYGGDGSDPIQDLLFTSDYRLLVGTVFDVLEIDGSNGDVLGLLTSSVSRTDVPGRHMALVSPIPVPPALPLMGTAIALMAFLGRRRR